MLERLWTAPLCGSNPPQIHQNDVYGYVIDSSDSVTDTIWKQSPTKEGRHFLDMRAPLVCMALNADACFMHEAAWPPFTPIKQFLPLNASSSSIGLQKWLCNKQALLQCPQCADTWQLNEAKTFAILLSRHCLAGALLNSICTAGMACLLALKPSLAPAGYLLAGKRQQSKRCKEENSCPTLTDGQVHQRPTSFRMPGG